MRRTKLGVTLEASAKGILAHVKGIRSQAGMSQVEFTRAFSINPRTLQEREQGSRKPDSTSRAYLAVIAKNRQAALDAMRS